MVGWYYTYLFVFAILTVLRNVLIFFVKLFSSEPTKYIIKKEERWLLALTSSYIITYLIY